MSKKQKEVEAKEEARRKRKAPRTMSKKAYELGIVAKYFGGFESVDDAIAYAVNQMLEMRMLDRLSDLPADKMYVAFMAMANMFDRYLDLVERQMDIAERKIMIQIQRMGAFQDILARQDEAAVNRLHNWITMSANIIKAATESSPQPSQQPQQEQQGGAVSQLVEGVREVLEQFEGRVRAMNDTLRSLASMIAEMKAHQQLAQESQEKRTQEESIIHRVFGKKSGDLISAAVAKLIEEGIKIAVNKMLGVGNQAKQDASKFASSLFDDLKGSS